MESSLKNMVLVLLLTTLAAAGMVGVVYSVTEEPIETAKGAKTTSALAGVLGEFDNDPAAEADTLALDGMQIVVYRATDKGVASGYAVETMTRSGFSGDVRLMVGFMPDGVIRGIEVLQQNETPGLGSKMADEGNPLELSFVGKNAAEIKMAVRKDQGDVDAITASTISSRAYVDAVQRAWTAFQSVALGEDTRVDHVAAVLPPHDNDPRAEAVESGPATVYRAAMSGETVGYAVEVSSCEGYAGTIKMMVGLLPDGAVNGVSVVEQNETAGIGSQVADEDNALTTSIRGKNIGELSLALRADGGDVDALSGATITSQAYVDALAQAAAAFAAIKTREGGL